MSFRKLQKNMISYVNITAYLSKPHTQYKNLLLTMQFHTDASLLLGSGEFWR